MLNSYLDLSFEIIRKADNSRYGDNNVMGPFNFAPIALFSSFILTTSSEKQLEDISQGHIVSLLYKLKTSSKDSNDLSIEIDPRRNRKREELAQIKNMKSSYCLRMMLKDVFRFAECREKPTTALVIN